MKSGLLAMLCVYALLALLFIELGPMLRPWKRLIFYAYWPYIAGYSAAVFVNLWALFYWIARKAGFRESGRKLQIFDQQFQGNELPIGIQE